MLLYDNVKDAVFVFNSREKAWLCNTLIMASTSRPRVSMDSVCWEWPSQIPNGVWDRGS